MTCPSKTYKVGDTPWHATYTTNKETRLPCPVCFAKCEVVLTLGNDDQVTIPCGYCAPGYESPRGWVFENRPYAAAEQVTITSIDITETAAGQERRYYGSSHVYRPENLFDTEPEATARAAELAESERVLRLERGLSPASSSQPPEADRVSRAHGGLVQGAGEGDNRMTTAEDSRIAAKNGRWYTTPSGVVVPSVTTILSIIDKGQGFERWLGNHRSYEDAIAERDAAGARGTAVHEIIADGLCMGRLLRPEECDDRVWKLVLGFGRWWAEWQPTLIASEVYVYTDTYAGTCDLIVEKDGEVWTLDVKTGSDVYRPAHYQTAAYAAAWEEMGPIRPVSRTAILHLKTSTKKGWQLIPTPARHWADEDLKCFNAARLLWHAEHGHAPNVKEVVEVESEVALWPSTV
jgi:hypothetical protein